MSSKFPRIFHLPNSPGLSRDDKRIETAERLLGQPMVVSEKVDGSNVCLEASAVYARSHSGPPSHPSFDALKALHASLKWAIEEGVQVFGEWCWAKHSILYKELPNYLMIIGVRKGNVWQSWSEVMEIANTLCVATVPYIDTVIFNRYDGLLWATEHYATQPSVVGGEDREGIVVRPEGEFKDEDFELSVAKWVRADHVQTEDHWSNQKIIRNSLRAK